MLFGKRKRIVKRILVVEDEPLTAFDNEVMLAGLGYDAILHALFVGFAFYGTGAEANLWGVALLAAGLVSAAVALATWPSKSVIVSTVTVPATAAWPITGGRAPAAPPMTMFCAVQRFRPME